MIGMCFKSYKLTRRYADECYYNKLYVKLLFMVIQKELPEQYSHNSYFFVYEKKRKLC